MPKLWRHSEHLEIDDVAKLLALVLEEQRKLLHVVFVQQHLLKEGSKAVSSQVYSDL